MAKKVEAAATKPDAAPAKLAAKKTVAAAKNGPAPAASESATVAAEAAVAKKSAPAKKAAAPVAPAATLPPIKGETKDGIKYTKDFDVKFLTAQKKLLLEARESLTGQAVRLEDEANSLIDDEMGDVQFDDESGEGDTMVVERERDLFLSARARNDIEEIDMALRRLASGAYGYSVVSMKPIPRERLEAIPWATELTEEKVGGIGRR
jgi:RNA polymerase-binding transcription factor DksA